jgi:hypothetical protein
MPRGSLPARIKGIRYASNPTHAALDTDIGDVCLIEFSDENAADFFGNSPYIIDENTVATSIANHDLSIAGVLKEKTAIYENTITSGYCHLQMRDGGPYSRDPVLRRAWAVFRDPVFTTVSGISGSPVFDETAGVLCGMVVRGGMNGPNCEILYVDVFDIMKLLGAVSAGAESTFYMKTLEPPTRVT